MPNGQAKFAITRRAVENVDFRVRSECYLLKVEFAIDVRKRLVGQGVVFCSLARCRCALHIQAAGFEQVRIIDFASGAMRPALVTVILRNPACSRSFDMDKGVKKCT
jgi:hypothetical protein